MTRLLLRGLIYAALIGGSALFAVPFYWMVRTSLMAPENIYLYPPQLIPNPIRLANYPEMWNTGPFLSWIRQSLTVALVSMVGETLASMLAAYGFSRVRWPGRDRAFVFVLATTMMPYHVVLIPRYLLFRDLGWLNSLYPLIVPNLFGSAFYIFLQRQFFLGLPRELFEAARVDGASYAAMFRRIALPLSIPSLIIIFLFEFQASWNGLQAALIYLNAGSVEGFTVPLGIAYAMTKYSPTAGGQGDYQYVMVAALLVTLPMLVLFAFGQRYFVEGVATQGRKG